MKTSINTGASTTHTVDITLLYKQTQLPTNEDSLVSDESNHNIISGLKVFPNPFNNNVVLEYTTFTSGFVSLSIYDLQGKLIERLVNGKQEQGFHSITWDAEQVSKGLYRYSIVMDDYIQNGLIIKAD